MAISSRDTPCSSSALRLLRAARTSDGRDDRRSHRSASRQRDALLGRGELAVTLSTVSRRSEGRARADRNPARVRYLGRPGRSRPSLEFFAMREGRVESLQLYAWTPSASLFCANRQGFQECYNAAGNRRRASRWFGWHPMKGSPLLIAWETTRARSGARSFPRSLRTGSVPTTSRSSSTTARWRRNPGASRASCAR